MITVVLPVALVAVTDTGEVAAEVGVPVITPVLELIDNPVGKPLALKLDVLFVAMVV